MKERPAGCGVEREQGVNCTMSCNGYAHSTSCTGYSSGQSTPRTVLSPTRASSCSLHLEQAAGRVVIGRCGRVRRHSSAVHLAAIPCPAQPTRSGSTRIRRACSIEEVVIVVAGLACSRFVGCIPDAHNGIRGGPMLMYWPAWACTLLIGT